MQYLTIAIGALGLTGLAGASALSAQDIEPLPEPVPSETPMPDMEAPAEPVTDDAGIPIEEPVPADLAPPVPVDEEDMPPPTETDDQDGADEVVDPLDPAGMEEEPETEEPL